MSACFWMRAGVEVTTTGTRGSKKWCVRGLEEEAKTIDNNGD